MSSKLKKDGRYLNCYIERELLDEFELICELVHKTKTKVLEDAMRKTIASYASGGGIDKNSIKNGIFLKENAACKILGTVDMAGQPYCVILFEDHVLRVPQSEVKEK